jgi:murein DD-endopeptidase MepM/ murein hydrolase activator NlpD
MFAYGLSAGAVGVAIAMIFGSPAHQFANDIYFELTKSEIAAVRTMVTDLDSQMNKPQQWQLPQSATHLLTVEEPQHKSAAEPTDLKKLLSLAMPWSAPELLELRGDVANLKSQLAAVAGGVAERQRYADEVQALLGLLPLGKPVVGILTSGFGSRVSPVAKGKKQDHTGIDIGAKQGSAIQVRAPGVVSRVVADDKFNGNYIEISHGRGIETTYSHLDSIHVRKGDTVRVGDIIGAVGKTGSATGTHLHYEIRFNGVPVDPEPYFKFDQPAALTASTAVTH